MVVFFGDELSRKKVTRPVAKAIDLPKKLPYSIVWYSGRAPGFAGIPRCDPQARGTVSTHPKIRSLNTVAVIGNSLPRKCGIATFTSDLCDALEAETGETGRVLQLAMNDVPEGYRYPDRVRFELQANVPSDYHMAADFLNINQIDIAILQHEFGIYGGPAGVHILRLLRELRMPFMTTLHTVLTEPNEDQRTVMTELVEMSSRLIVMSERAKGMLMDTYKVNADQVAFIPHGIPDVPFVDPNFYKDQFGVEGRKVILTFGLLSPNKGIEVMLNAMPQIVDRYPDAVFIVLGATHPHVLRESGEEYRQGLQRIVHEHQMEEHVIFQNRFVSLEELCQYIGAADVYVTPYLNPAQITSGTLAYSLGAGKAVVSTPYWYAEELLDEGRGKIVPFHEVDALAEGVVELFENEIERHAMRKRAYQFCRSMIWKEVARSYIELGREVLAERAKVPHPISSLEKQAKDSIQLPDPDLRHLRTLTDDTGILRHAIFSTADRRYGYCSVDNAQALVATQIYQNLLRDDSVIPLMHTYLAFISSSYNPDSGRFRSNMSYDRQWQDAIGDEDTHARVLWGLGVTAAATHNDAVLSMSTRLFADALPPVADFVSAQAWAFALVGIHAYLARFRGDAEARRCRDNLANRLFSHFKDHATKDWLWCDDTVAYASGKLPHALILSGQWVPDARMTEMGLKCLTWLLSVQTGEEKQLSVVGSEGWMSKDGTRANFDQLAVEVMHLIDACSEAYLVTRDPRWIKEARRCLEWFLGRNDLRAPLYDFKTGGCGDGLTPQGPSSNQGAESTVAWLISLIKVHDLLINETFRPEKAKPSRKRRKKRERN
ncbi:MAG: glycosyltransferase [Planctomycetes bacterium]|nr:glycosyltransferase [Planctomycetota bacterium]